MSGVLGSTCALVIGERVPANDHNRGNGEHIRVHLLPTTTPSHLRDCKYSSDGGPYHICFGVGIANIVV